MKEEVENLLKKKFDSENDVIKFISNYDTGVDHTHVHTMLKVISDKFEGLSRIKRHKIIYDIIGDKINSGEIHALRINAKTHKEVE